MVNNSLKFENKTYVQFPFFLFKLQKITQFTIMDTNVTTPVFMTRKSKLILLWLINKILVIYKN